LRRLRAIVTGRFGGALVLLPFVWLTHRFWFVADDAFISFRFARNLAEGHGLRYNLGAHVPVEGYSNFLWVIVGSALERMHLPQPVVMPMLSALCGLALLVLVLRRARTRFGFTDGEAAVVALLLATYPPFALWSTGGLATMPFALLVFVVFDQVVLAEAPRPVPAVAALVLLALLRVEGILWCVGILVIGLSGRVASHRPARPLLLPALLSIPAWAVYFLWRAHYHGDWIPNTVTAKSGFGAPFFLRGVHYVLSHALVFVTPFLLVPGTVSAARRGRIGISVAVVAWASILWAVASTGDFMPMGRLLASGFAFQVIVIGWWLQDVTGRRPRAHAALAALLILVQLLPAFDLHAVPLELRKAAHFRESASRFRSESMRWRGERRSVELWSATGRLLRTWGASRGLEPREVRYVTHHIGAEGFYSDLTILDPYGLVNREIAHLPTPDQPSTPGHDKGVSRFHFLKDDPHILRAQPVEDAEDEYLIRSVEQLRDELVERGPRMMSLYVPDFLSSAEPVPGLGGSVALWVRIPDGVDPEDAWADFQRRLEKRKRMGEPGGR